MSNDETDPKNRLKTLMWGQFRQASVFVSHLGWLCVWFCEWLCWSPEQ